MENLQPGSWIKECPAPITVTDTEGVMIEMNDAAAEMFKKDGGYDLLGTNVFDCHPEKSRAALEALYKDQQFNIYTIEKEGVKKMIWQAQWTQDGQFAGVIEIVYAIPFDLPHFVRD